MAAVIAAAVIWYISWVAAALVAFDVLYRPDESDTDPQLLGLVFALGLAIVGPIVGILAGRSIWRRRGT